MENGPGMLSGIISLAIVAFIIVSFWKVFVKAGQPGWGSIVPIYNIYLLIVIARRPWWWLLLSLVPFVNIIIGIMISIDIAKKFGKGTGFGLGLAFLGFIFYPILAFGDAEYSG